MPGEGPTLRVGAACKASSTTGTGMWLCTRRLQAGGFAWPREDSGALDLTREQLDWLVAGLPWQRLGVPRPQSITAV